MINNRVRKMILRVDDVSAYHILYYNNIVSIVIQIPRFFSQINYICTHYKNHMLCNDELQGTWAIRQIPVY